MYARGILFGKMKYELGDHSFVRCPELGLSADIEFKTKGWVSGVYNAIGGTIKNEQTGETLFELSGLWSEEMFIKNLKVSRDTLHSVWSLTVRSRPGIRRCSSTLGERSHQHHYRDQLKNKRGENLNDCGKKLLRPSRTETTSWRHTR